jgi:hypothetical protein
MERAAKGVWKQGPAIVHVSRRDVQNYALAAKKQREGIVAKNFSRAN